MLTIVALAFNSFQDLGDNGRAPKSQSTNMRMSHSQRQAVNMAECATPTCMLL